MPKRALILEMHTHHGFVIASQHAFLREAGYEVHIVVHEQLVDLDLIRTMSDSAVVTVIESRHYARAMLRLCVDIMRGYYDFLVLNTVAWKNNRILQQVLISLLPPFRRFRIVIHHVSDEYVTLVRSLHEARLSRLRYYGRRLILSRSSRLYLLSQTAYDTLRRTYPPDPKVEYFYPSYFPTVPVKTPDQSDGRVSFCVLGEIDNSRRNYQSLAACFEAIRNSPLRDQIEIRLLGSAHKPDGKRLLELAEASGLLGTVIKPQTERHAPFLSFADQITSSHFILLLLDNQIPIPYNRAVVPSSMMLGRGFAVPFVSSSDLPLEADILPYTVAYDGQAVLDGIASAVEIARSPQYAVMRDGFRQHMHDIFPENQQRYLR